MEVVSQLEGAFALLIKSTHFPDELMAAKKGSPLLLGASCRFRRPSPHWQSCSLFQQLVRHCMWHPHDGVRSNSISHCYMLEGTLHALQLVHDSSCHILNPAVRLCCRAGGVVSAGGPHPQPAAVGREPGHAPLQAPGAQQLRGVLLLRRQRSGGAHPPVRTLPSTGNFTRARPPDAACSSWCCGIHSLPCSIGCLQHVLGAQGY